jgi:hypothetical protein
MKHKKQTRLPPAQAADANIRPTTFLYMGLVYPYRTLIVTLFNVQKLIEQFVTKPRPRSQIKQLTYMAMA